MSPEKFDINQLQLEEIVVVNASINNSTKIAVLNKDNEELDITYNIQPGVNFELKKIRILFECDLKLVNTPGIEGKFELAFFFSIGNFDELIEMKNKEVNIAPELIASISNVVYSTSRGIIYSRCLGTIFKNVILPIVATNELINAAMTKEE